MYFSKNVDVVVVIFVFLFVLVFEDKLFLGVVDGGFEYLVGPLVLSSPVVILVFVFEVVVSDIWVTITYADVHSFVF